MTKFRWVFGIFRGSDGCVSRKGHKYYIDEKYKKINSIARYVGIAFGIVAILIPDFFANTWFNFLTRLFIAVFGQVIRYFILPKDFAKFITIEKEEN